MVTCHDSIVLILEDSFKYFVPVLKEKAMESLTLFFSRTENGCQNLNSF